MPGLLEPDYEPHYTAWKTQPTPEATDALLGSVKPILNEALRTYGSDAAASPTMRGKAKVMALKAMGTYDPARAKLRTHLLTQLQGLRRLAARETQLVRVPEQLGLDRLRLLNSENELRDRLGRDPSDHELADHAGLSRRRIGRIRQVPGAHAEGAMTRIDEEGTGVWQPAVQSGIGDRTRALWQEMVMMDLDPINQVIMRDTLGLNGQPVRSNQEIAQRLRLSPGAISQRKAKIQEKLDSMHDTGLMG